MRAGRGSDRPAWGVENRRGRWLYVRARALAVSVDGSLGHERFTDALSVSLQIALHTTSGIPLCVAVLGIVTLSASNSRPFSNAGSPRIESSASSTGFKPGYLFHISAACSPRTRRLVVAPSSASLFRSCLAPRRPAHMCPIPRLENQVSPAAQAITLKPPAFPRALRSGCACLVSSQRPLRRGLVS